MGTKSTKLYDILLTGTLRDFRLNKLYVDNPQALYDYLKTFLDKAIISFDNDAISSLAYTLETDDEGYVNPVFIEVLKPLEELILIDYMEMIWTKLFVQDAVTQLQMISNKTDKMINADANIKYKLENIESLKENISANIRELQQIGLLDKLQY